MEARRKIEEEERRRQEEVDRKAAEFLAAEREKEIALRREQLEQERRDLELALRLAKESNGQVEDFNSIPRSYVYYFFIEGLFSGGLA